MPVIAAPVADREWGRIGRAGRCVLIALVFLVLLAPLVPLVYPVDLQVGRFSLGAVTTTMAGEAPFFFSMSPGLHYEGSQRWALCYLRVGDWAYAVGWSW